MLSWLSRTGSTRFGPQTKRVKGASGGVTSLVPTAGSAGRWSWLIAFQLARQAHPDLQGVGVGTGTGIGVGMDTGAGGAMPWTSFTKGCQAETLWPALSRT